MDSFSEFWSFYPRKIAKKDALKMWARLTDEQRAAALSALPRHIEVWNAEGRDVCFIPYPATWIHGERWEDVLIMPKPQIHGTSQQSIVERGIRMSLPPKPGESMEQYRRRINEARH